MHRGICSASHLRYSHRNCFIRINSPLYRQLSSDAKIPRADIRRPVTQPSRGRGIRRIIKATTLLVIFGVGYLYITDTRAAVHTLTPKILRQIYPDAEEAHEVGNAALKWLFSRGLHPRERPTASPVDLSVTVFGHRLDSPIGTSAGIDKKAEIPDGLFALGASIVEVGGATPRPQSGNPRPRVWRLPSQNGLINRYGLNSLGAEAMVAVLQRRVQAMAAMIGLGCNGEQELLDYGYGRYRPFAETSLPPGSLHAGKLLAVQIAKNKDTPDDDIRAIVADYVQCVEHLGRYADILVVNVSSPNTPGLRGLQAKGPLTDILTDVVRAATRVDRARKPRVMVKVSPDEDSDTQIHGVCEAVRHAGVDGVIVGNTTKQRPDASSATDAQILAEQGGYSGPQLFERTVRLVGRYRVILDEANAQGETPKVIFATGGITNGEQALQALEAGASVAQMYTALVYGGAGTITRVKQEMRDSIIRRSKT